MGHTFSNDSPSTLIRTWIFCHKTNNFYAEWCEILMQQNILMSCRNSNMPFFYYPLASSEGIGSLSSLQNNHLGRPFHIIICHTVQNLLGKPREFSGKDMRYIDRFCPRIPCSLHTRGQGHWRRPMSARNSLGVSQFTSTAFRSLYKGLSHNRADCGKLINNAIKAVLSLWKGVSHRLSINSRHAVSFTMLEPCEMTLKQCSI